MKEIKLSPDSRMIKLLSTFDNLFLACIAGVEMGRGYSEEEKWEGDWGEFPFSLSRFSPSPFCAYHAD